MKKKNLLTSLVGVQSQNCDSQTWKSETKPSKRDNTTTSTDHRVKGQSGKATIFSTEKKILTLYRSHLLPENIEATLCTKSWLYGFESNLIFL